MGAALLVSACSSGAAPAHVDRSTFHSNITAWNLPLDDYRTPTTEAYALNLWIHNCMAPRGVDIPVSPIAAVIPMNQNQYGRALFNRDYVAKYGYHSVTSASATARPAPTVSPGQQAAEKSCAQSGEAKFTTGQDLDSFIQSLAYAAYLQAQSAPAVRAAAKRWRVCMLPLGLPDLPSSPLRMPSPSQRTMFLGVGTHATPIEIRQALYDSNCRSSSSYEHTLYTTEIGTEFQLMDRNANKVNAAFDATQRALREIRHYLQANGP